MDQRTRPTIRRQDLDEVKGIVRRLTTRKRPARQKSRWVMRVENGEKLVRALGLIGLLECVVLAIVSVAFDSLALLRTVSAMSILVTLLAIALLISPIVLSVPFFRTLYRTPFAPLLEALDDDMALDMSMVVELMECDREAVEYVLAHYRHQRNAFEKRGMMLAGALDKIGFFPALVTFAMLLIPAWEHLDVWIRSFALLVPAFHFMNLLSYGLTQEMDRTIALLEYSLTARKRAEG
ncbi:hypothetical protein [Burkholderia multivorans]|uniref:hypothetical protein n=1 Tax=Burkholderia multivorans TaxID=87883 RepID=UPI0011B2305E|nr:hypothetical protein [Burkholderia multivorans]